MATRRQVLIATIAAVAIVAIVAIVTIVVTNNRNTSIRSASSHTGGLVVVFADQRNHAKRILVVVHRSDRRTSITRQTRDAASILDHTRICPESS